MCLNIVDMHGFTSQIVKLIEERIGRVSFMPVENGEGLQVLRYEVQRTRHVLALSAIDTSYALFGALFHIRSNVVAKALVRVFNV